MLVNGEYALDLQSSGSGIDSGAWMTSDSALDPYLIHSSVFVWASFSGCKWCSDD